MSKKKLESKYTSPNNHMWINDAGIGSNRIVIANNYLNTFNYYNRSTIKLLEFRKHKSLERKLLSEEFKNMKTIPGMAYSTSYYNYGNYNNKNNRYSTINYDNNQDIKQAEINYLNDLIDLRKKDKHHKLKLNLKRIKVKENPSIFKSLFSDLNNRNISHKTLKKNNDFHNNSHNGKKCYLSNHFQNKNKNYKTLETYYKLPKNNDFKIYRNDFISKVFFRKTFKPSYKKRIFLSQNKKDNICNKSNKELKNEIRI